MIKCKVNFRDNLIAASNMSPSYFEAAHGRAYEWLQHSAGFVSSDSWVSSWLGARPDSY